MEITAAAKFDRFRQLVGNTPMLEIWYEYKGKTSCCYAKCEQYNLSGSIKDRMALHILEKAYAQGALLPGNRIVEATGGNTALSFSVLGRAFEHPVTIILPENSPAGREALLRSLGATVISGAGSLECLGMAAQQAWQDPGVFLPRQFQNRENSNAHEETTGPEIWAQLEGLDRLPDAFVAGVGTGGTIMGVGSFLKGKNPLIRIHPLEAVESPLLSTGYQQAPHSIEGISPAFIPALLDLSRLDEVIRVAGDDAIRMTQLLAKQLGIVVGASSGANLIGAIRTQQELGSEAVVVTVFPDGDKQHLAGGREPTVAPRETDLSGQVRFLDYRPVKRKDE